MTSAGQRRDVAAGIDALTDTQLWRMLEALSYTYRVNGMWRMLSDPAHHWIDIEVPVDLPVLTGLGKAHVDRFVRSKAIGRNPVRFAEHLAAYFAEHGRRDPEGLAEFRPKRVPAARARIVVARRRDRFLMRDGSHRLLSLVQSGATTVRAYCALSNGTASAPMMGDAVAVTLNRLLVEDATNDADRSAILRVTELLAASSHDGRSAIERYWTELSPHKLVRSEGQALLERLG